jgi:hypothetical protein
MDELKNKKVLIYIPFGKGIYGTALMKELQSRGCEVYVFDERPSTGTFTKIAFRIAKTQMRGYFNRYLRKTIREVKVEDIDYVLIIRAEAFTLESMDVLKSTFTEAKFILYLWDSINYTNTKDIFPCFDKVASFDKEDAEKFGLQFRPLFFIDDYRKIAEQTNALIDLIFIGKVHSDRYKFLKEFEENANLKGLKTYFYLFIPTRLMYFQFKYFDKSFKNAKISEFFYEMIPGYKAAELLGKSCASLDIQHPTQTGLTMRTIEVLGSKRKLITTNKEIKKYDFYRPENIFVIDREFPDFDFEFLKQPYSDLPNDIYEKYSLKGWVNEVFS